jgi:GTP-binding protein LepA
VPEEIFLMQRNIRNFCIIAHIDHGKSTLADRILECTGTVAERKMTNQLLDSMELERERGITIKLKAVRNDYSAKDGQVYRLNLIDTPGHVDFSYEVSRSLAACEGALLVVDASQGIEAQTIANFYLALEHDLEIIPVINKIDLPSAEPDRIMEEIEDVLGLNAADCIPASAKTGEGISEIMEAIVKRIPPPEGGSNQPLKALIFDSHFDQYKGVISYVRVFEGSVTQGMNIRMMSTGKEFEVIDVGCFTPGMESASSLSSGEVGYIAAGMKQVDDAAVGDTITDAAQPTSLPLPGYKKALPMVFAGLYPVDTVEYAALREALEKLKLNDANLITQFCITNCLPLSHPIVKLTWILGKNTNSSTMMESTWINSEYVSSWTPPS